MAPSIHRITSLKLFFIPIQTRVPLKFGPETLTSVTCLRVAMGVVDEQNHYVEGWGETPLSVQWVWPSSSSYERRLEALEWFCQELAGAWMRCATEGHALEVGSDFQSEPLVRLWNQFNKREIPSAVEGALAPSTKPLAEPLPWLAALVCNSAFDVALHDAYGRIVDRPVYETYGPAFLKRDLAWFLEPAGSGVSFRGRYPADYIVGTPPKRLVAWHLVGGL